MCHFQLWSTFTRIKDFKPLRTQVICELHFTADCINEQKNAIKSKSVPTIYYRDGDERVEVSFSGRV
jgi:hypothetical protein